MTRHDLSFAAILIEEDRRACVRQFAAGRFFISARARQADRRCLTLHQ